MGRNPRAEFAGATYHLTVRGNNRRRIYLDDRDRELFLSLLRSTVIRCSWRCHTYCLMNNHYHAVVETPEPNLGAGMRRLNGVYARLFNQRQGRQNHLFGARYGAKVIESDEYFLEACRYVVLNPVRAELCEAVDEWPWSSYGAISGLERPPRWLEINFLLNQFATDRTVAQDLYAKFVAAGPARASLDGLLAAA
jgi:putative transposase